MSEDGIVHLAHAHKRDGLPEFGQQDSCPTCNVVCEDGFGLAGGGMGVYTYCPKCYAITSKSEFPDE